MKEIEEQIEIAKLLSGKVLDALQDSEKESLSEWESNPKNIEKEKSILNEEAFNNWNASQEKINTSEHWNSFLLRMNKPKRTVRIKPKTFYLTIASIAASLIIGFFLLYNIPHNIDKEYQSIAEVNIQPGSLRAQLIMDNGEVIDLEKTTQSQLKLGNFSVVNNNGHLKYSNTDSKTSEPVTNTLKIPKGGEYQLELPDGTKVWVNSDTELKFTVPFATDKREVILKGEAYFEVAHNASKPFIVITENQSIEVLGTKFNISAYPEDLNVITTLAQGKVKVSHTLNNNKIVQEYLLPNEQTVLNKETLKIDKQKVDASLYSSWKNGRFAFQNEPLEEFLKKVSRWYNVEAYITDESLKGIRFTGDLPRYKNMKELLTILEAETSVHIDVENNKIIYVSK